MKKLLFAVVFLLATVQAHGQVVYADMSLTSPSTVTTAVGTSSVISNLSQYTSMGVVATLQGGTGGTLDVYIQVRASDASGANIWVDYAHFAQLAAGASAIIRSFSTSKQAQQTTLQTVGLGLTPALAASTIVGGNFGDQIRVVFVTGSGTSAGAVQLLRFWFSK